MKTIAKLMLCTVALVHPVVHASSTPDSPHLMTTGYGQVVATPDMAEFSVKVIESKSTAERAKKAVDQAVTEFLEALASQGVKKEDISSSNLYLAPQYHYPKEGKAELTGYRASRTIKVSVGELGKLNQFLDVALKSGINQVDNIELKVKDKASYIEKARAAAIKDAQQKAESVAQGFGQQLGGVWRVTYNNSSQPVVATRAMAMDSRMESNSYQDSSIVIRDRVEVVFKLD